MSRMSHCSQPSPQDDRPSASRPLTAPRNTSKQHAPTTPSRLRTSINMSPEERFIKDEASGNDENGADSAARLAQLTPIQSPLRSANDPAVSDIEVERQPDPVETRTQPVDSRTALLEDYHRSQVCGSAKCDHGTFTPQARSIKSRRSSTSSTNSIEDQGDGEIERGNPPRSKRQGLILGNMAGILFREESSDAAKSAWSPTDPQNPRYLYLSYYLPFLKWIRQYRWKWLRGDLIAAVTMASFYIPMALSYASNLGHVPPINGLYSFVFNPVIYALLGTSPQMVVGPEAAGSLLVGTVVQTCIDRGQSHEADDVLNAQIAGVVTGIAGAVIFVAGITRLGFLDSVLSRPFLRGFISAIGFVIIVDQLIPELGLSEAANRVDGVTHGSSAVKILFLIRNIGQSHGLTAAVSIVSFVVIMVFRYCI